MKSLIRALLISLSFLVLLSIYANLEACDLIACNMINEPQETKTIIIDYYNGFLRNRWSSNYYFSQNIPSKELSISICDYDYTGNLECWDI